ncbi:MAG: hypothetical protein AB7K09_07670 [Planctomycetota bacterium]
MTLRDLMAQQREQIPQWLASLSTDAPFPRDAFLRSRTVYYPGSGTDGHPLRLFGAAHAAHCFVFADYGVGSAEILTQLGDQDHPGHPAGYRPVFARQLEQTDLVPHGWTPNAAVAERARGRHFIETRPPGGPYAVWAVVERRDGFGNDHGPERLAIIVVGGDGIATYDALFCNRDQLPPFAVVIQDHGFGGNWTTFGGEQSPLWELARHAPPEWLLVGDNTSPWPGYARQSDDAEPGGMGGRMRSLCRRLR